MSGPDLTPTRLEAFSDGVIAIIITIMVLELKVPHSESLAALHKLWPIFLSYILSYLMVAIYWINHHHLFHRVKRVDAGILWANMILLFFMSLIPFFTAYMGENHISTFSVTLYSSVMLICALSFTFLRKAISRHFKDDEDYMKIYRAASRKNNAAILFYVMAVAMAQFNVAISLCLLVLVASMYIVPTAWVEKCVGR